MTHEPNKLDINANVKTINDDANGLYPVWAAYIAYCLFLFVTVATTRPPNLLIGAFVKVPILSADVDIVGFSLLRRPFWSAFMSMC